MKFQFNGHDLSIDDRLAEINIHLHNREKNYNNFTLLICDGIMGSGKSNMAGLICAHKASLSGQEYNVNHVFFDADQMIKFAVSTTNQIIHFDEALFASLASDWQSKIVKKLLKMVQLCRKKKHFMVFCLPNFFQLKDFIANEASVGLVHCYLKGGIDVGRFVYFKQKSKEILYSQWKRSGLKDYKKYYSFRGSFIAALPLVINEEEYEIKKDKAIMTLADDDKPKVDKNVEKLIEMRYKVSQLPQLIGIKQLDLCKYLSITPRTMRLWSKKTPPSKEYEVLEVQERGQSLNQGVREEKTSDWSGVEEDFGDDKQEEPIIVEQEAV